LAFLSILIAPISSARATATPEERPRWAEICHKLESNPLDGSVHKDGERAFNRLAEVHGICVPLCRALLGEFNDPQSKYGHQITRQ
jgi:hypothetical protein